MLSDQFNRFGVATLHHVAHLLVDLLRNRIRHITTGHQIPAEEHLLATTLKGNGSKVGHAETGDHLTRH